MLRPVTLYDHACKSMWSLQRCEPGSGQHDEHVDAHVDDGHDIWHLITTV